jgi:flagellar hook assembly protein FlgD
MFARRGNNETAKSALDLINVVPNPYYAYSGYEKNQLDNRVKITNLPTECTIKIYTTSGVLVRTYEKADPSTSLDWDMKNQANITISSGIYIIHVNVPNVGEKIVKFFGVMRPIDLDTF